MYPTVMLTLLRIFRLLSYSVIILVVIVVNAVFTIQRLRVTRRPTQARSKICVTSCSL